METKNGKPLLTLVARTDGKASYVAVAQHSGSWLAASHRLASRVRLAFVRVIGRINRMSSLAIPDDLLTYEPKRDKIIEGVLLLLEQAGHLGVDMNRHRLQITMFLADKEHLDAYERPVFFDNYVATASGPQGVTAAEMLDSAYVWSAVGLDAAPWTSNEREPGDILHATRPPNLRRLSRSDVAALSSALTMTASLTAKQLELFTHRTPAYSAAWRDGAGDGARLDPRLVPDVQNDDLIDDLIYASRHAFNARAS